MLDLVDLVVEVPQERQAVFESWLLGHGRLPVLASGRTRKGFHVYSVRGATPREQRDIPLVRGSIVQSRPVGERPSHAEAVGRFAGSQNG